MLIRVADPVELYPNLDTDPTLKKTDPDTIFEKIPDPGPTLENTTDPDSVSYLILS